MANPIAVVTSDCHLQERAWASRPMLNGDAIWAFECIVDHACKLDVPIIGAGDLIDKQENSSSVPGFIRRMMDQCYQSLVPVYFIQGQHELQGDPWLSELSDWPLWLHDEQRGAVPPFGGYKLCGIDWTPAGELEEWLSKVPENTDILVMHQVCQEFMGSITTPELSWGMIPNHVKLLIIGDYHGEHQRLEKERPDGSKLIILSPGSTCMQAIDEPPVKKFFVLYDDLSTESVLIPSRPYLRPPDILLDEDLDEFVEKVVDHLRAAVERAASTSLPADQCMPIIYVRYAYDLKDAHRRIKEAIGDYGHFFEKQLRPKTEEQVEARAERKNIIDGGLIGALTEVAPDRDSHRYHVARWLLSAKNPREELTKIRKEFLENKVPVQESKET